MSARSTSSRSTSSRSTSVRSRSNGPWKTSRSRSREATRIASTLMRGSDAHLRADVGDRLARDRLRLRRPLCKHVVEVRLVALELAIALADRPEPLGHGRGHGLLEVAVAGAGELA